MRLSLAALIAALVLLLSPVGTSPTQAANAAPVGKRANHKHKHFKLYVAKKTKHFHLVHTFKTAQEAHKAAQKYHKKGYKTKVHAA